MASESNGRYIKLPFYAKASLIIIGLFVLFSMLALGKSIIVPLLFAIILSILLSTLVDYLEVRKVDRVLAIWISLLLALLIVVLAGSWSLSQFNMFVDKLPELNERVDVVQDRFATWLSEQFDISARK